MPADEYIPATDVFRVLIPAAISRRPAPLNGWSIARRVAAGARRYIPFAHTRGRALSRGLPDKPGVLVLAFVALAVTALSRADDWAPNLTLSSAWHSNASNAKASGDQIDTLQFKADMLASQRYPLGRSDAIHLSGHAAGEWWPRYKHLLMGAAGARAEWRHTFGVGTLAPVFSIEGAVDVVGADESGREGTSSGVLFALRKRFNDRTRISLWHEIGHHAARVAAFDREANETTLELDRDLDELTRLTLAVRYRSGDVLSYSTLPRGEFEALAPHRVELDTFDRPMIAYSIDANTWSARGALTRALDETSAIVLSYEWRDTEKRSLRFVNHLVTVGLVHQF